MKTTNFDKLIKASHRALAGTNAQDAWKVYGIEIEDAATFVMGWVDELKGKAAEFDLDPDEPAFVNHLALGMLAVGIEYGRTQPRADSAPPCLP